MIIDLRFEKNLENIEQRTPICDLRR